MNDAELEKIKEAEQSWRKTYEEKLKNRGVRDDKIIGPSDIEIKPLYTPADSQNINYLEDIGFPGEYPFTRGIYPFGFRIMPWRMRIYSGFWSAEECNRMWKKLLDAGEEGVSIALDLPTQLGLDSDNPRTEGHVGEMGMKIDTIKDLEIAFEGIPLNKIAVSSAQNTLAPLFEAMLIATAEKQGYSAGDVGGTTNNGGLMEFLGRGVVIFPVEFAVQFACDLAEYAAHNMPKFYPFNFPSGGLIQWSGSSPAEEIGYCFSCAFSHIDRLLARGLHIDEIAPKLSYSISANIRFLEEIPKIRAMRRLYARIMKEKYKAQKKESMLCKITSSPSGLEFSREFELNIVRSTCSVIAGALSGVQGIQIPGLNELYGIPDERANLYKLRLQQVLAYETDVTSTIDPLAGSYYIEAMTDKIEEKIREIIDDIDSHGGAVRTVESGYMQRSLTARSLDYQNKIESGDIIKVGENKFMLEEEPPRPFVPQYDPSVLQNQLKRLENVKANRRQDRVKECLERLKKTAGAGGNLMEPMINAAKAYATIQEMCDAIKSQVGEYQPIENVF